MTPPEPGSGDIAVVIVAWRNEGLARACAAHVRDAWPCVLLIVVKCGGPLTDVPEACVTLHTRNLGYAGGNNLGFGTALERGARFVVVLNSDAFPRAGALEHMRNHLIGNPSVGLVGATLRRWDRHGREEVTLGLRYDWSNGRVTRLVPPDDRLDYPGGAFLMFRAEALTEVGGFDANLFLYGEEIDWCERARLAGFKVAVEAAAEAIHLGSITVSQAMKASTFFNFRNTILVRRRYAARHGVQVRSREEVRRGVRAMAGHLYHRRFRLIWPIVVALRQGLGGLPPVSDEPDVAIKQQVWETRDPIK